MATIYLNDGATSLAAANWSDATGLVNSATGVIRSGGQSITSDVDFNAVNVLSLRIAEQFTGTIGSAAAPLWLDATDGSAAEWSSSAAEGIIINGSGGTLFIKSDAGGLDNLHQSGAGRTTLVSGTATYLRVTNGEFSAEAASTVTNARILGGRTTIGASATAGTVLDVIGGTVTTARPFTTINVYDGDCFINHNTSSSAAVTINQYGGRVFLLSLFTNGTVNYNRFGGLFDPRRMTRELTVATMFTSARARFAGLPSGVTLTITTQSLRDADAQRI